MRRIVLAALVAATLLAAALPSRAQSNEDRLRDQLRQTTLQMRALQDENSALKVREQNLKAQAEAAASAPRPAAAVAPAPASAAAPGVDAQAVARLERRLRDEAAQKAALAGELAAARAEAARLREGTERGALAARSRDEEAARQREQIAAAEARGTAGDTALQRCSQMNEQLVGIGRELLDRYRNKGVSEALMDAEPVIGIARIRLETIAQTLQGRIKDNSVPATSP